MGDQLKCNLCNWSEDVSAEDPDATVDNAVHHAARTHSFDPRLGLPKSIELVLGSSLNRTVDGGGSGVR